MKQRIYLGVGPNTNTADDARLGGAKINNNFDELYDLLNTNFLGTYNATTNTPTLMAGVGETGKYYRVLVAGNQFSETFQIGDRIEYNGTTWILGDDTNQIADLSGFQKVSEKGQANGYASLGSNGKVPSSQLSSDIDNYCVFIQANNISFSSLNTWITAQTIFGFGTTNYGTSAVPNSNFSLNAGVLPIKPGYKLKEIIYGMFFKSSNLLTSTIEMFVQVSGVASQSVGNAGTTTVTVTQENIVSGSGTSNPKFFKNLTVADYSISEAHSYLQFSVREISNVNTLGLSLLFKFQKI